MLLAGCYPQSMLRQRIQLFTGPSEGLGALLCLDYDKRRLRRESPATGVGWICRIRNQMVTQLQNSARLGKEVQGRRRSERQCTAGESRLGKQIQRGSRRER